MKEIPTWRCVVAASLRRGDGRWLMAKRPANKHHGGLWEFPGGKVEPDEAPVNALVRELEEELGVVVEPAGLTPASFTETQQDGGAGAIVILLYTAHHWQGEPMALDPGAEIGWFERAEMRALGMPPLDIVLCRALLGDEEWDGGG